MKGICVCGYTEAEHFDIKGLPPNTQCPVTGGIYHEAEDESRETVYLPDVKIETEDTKSLDASNARIRTINEQLAAIVAHTPGATIKETITIDEQVSMTLIFSNALDMEVEQRR